MYVASDSSAVRLVDFNPVGGTTAPLLFTWEELGLEEYIAGSCLHEIGVALHDHAQEDKEDLQQQDSGNGAGLVMDTKCTPTEATTCVSNHVPAADPDTPTGSSDATAAAAVPVRFITDPIGIQPNKIAYMVPYDFVDDGPGGAAEGLWERLGALNIAQH